MTFSASFPDGELGDNSPQNICVYISIWQKHKIISFQWRPKSMSHRRRPMPRRSPRRRPTRRSPRQRPMPRRKPRRRPTRPLGSFFQQCDKYARQVALRSKQLKCFYDLLLQLQEQRAILHTRMVETTSVTGAASMQQLQNFEQQLMQWTVPDPWAPSDIRVSCIQGSSWGKLYGVAMQEWMSQFRWPAAMGSDNLGITWLELSLAFSWWTGYFFPVPRRTGRGQEALVILDNFAAVEAYQVKFSDIAKSFAIYHDQVKQLVIPHQWPVVERGLIRSLYNLGSSTFSSGFKVRPQYPGQEIIVPILREHYRQQKTTMHAAIPNIPLSPRWTKRQLQDDLRGSWSSRGSSFSKVAKELRSFAKDVSQSQISFRRT